MKGGGRKQQRASTRRLSQTLETCCGDPARMLELYYWSKEPGLLEVIRAIATMPEETRAALEAFVALARNVKSVSADLNGRGVLTLSSDEAAKAIALAHYVAAEDHDDVPRVLN